MAKREDKHVGCTFIETEHGLEHVELEPHTIDECEAKVEEAAMRVRGHQTVYEAPESRGVTVGYTRAYASRFDEAFGKN